MPASVKSHVVIDLAFIVRSRTHLLWIEASMMLCRFQASTKAHVASYSSPSQHSGCPAATSCSLRYFGTRAMSIAATQLCSPHSCPELSDCPASSSLPCPRNSALLPLQLTFCVWHVQLLHHQHSQAVAACSPA